MKKNNKGVILKQKGAKMAEDGKDWNGLEMTILKSLANLFKINERWRSSFNSWQPLKIILKQFFAKGSVTVFDNHFVFGE